MHAHASCVEEVNVCNALCVMDEMKMLGVKCRGNVSRPKTKDRVLFIEKVLINV